MLFSALSSCLVLLPSTSALQLSDYRLQKVYEVMSAISSQSYALLLLHPGLGPLRPPLPSSPLDRFTDVLRWENGTKAEAILEHDYPSFSVYSPTPALPLPNPLQSSAIQSIISIAQTTLQNRPATNTSAKASAGISLLTDGSAGDPASLGFAVLLANASTGNAQVNGVGYGDAATAELAYMLNDVPRTSSGAISHRADQAQLWSDFVYMAPPFIAYYGALTGNQTLLQTAYTQCQLYYNALHTSSGLWSHITGGTGAKDPGQWATGNAWAAAGMIRVLATIKQSSFAGGMGSQMGDLQNWAGEILGECQQYLTSDGLLRNYITDSTSFEDASGSALMAATGFRMSTLNLTNSYVNISTTLLSAVSTKVNSAGYLNQVVDPNDFSSQGAQSPEGQSFVVLAYAAYNEWDAMGRPGESGSSKSPLGKNSEAGRAVVCGIGGVVAVLAGVGVVVGWTIV